MVRLPPQTSPPPTLGGIMATISSERPSHLSQIRLFPKRLRIPVGLGCLYSSSQEEFREEARNKDTCIRIVPNSQHEYYDEHTQSMAERRLPRSRTGRLERRPRDRRQSRHRCSSAGSAIPGSPGPCLAGYHRPRPDPLHRLPGQQLPEPAEGSGRRHAGYLLNPDEGGLAQIASILADRHDVADISIIAHGNAGEVELGSTIVTQASLAASAAALRTIGSAIAPNGDVLVYGCDVGEGTTGQSFVDALAATTGAHVAAASHIVGDVAVGEGWNLDVTSTGSPITAPQVLSTKALDSYASPPLMNAPPTDFPISVTSFTATPASTRAAPPRSLAAATCS